MVRKRVPSSTLYFQHDSCESCGIYSFNQPSDCGLDPTVPTAEDLRNWVSALGFSINYWCQLRDLWALAAFSAAWGLCFPQNVLEAVAKLLCASMGTTGGTGWWKGGFGAEWGSLAHVQPLRNSHWLFQRMAMRGIKWNQDRNSVWPQASGKSCSFFSCPGRCNGQSLWVPCTIQCLGTSTPPTKSIFFTQAVKQRWTLARVCIGPFYPVLAQKTL